MKEPHQGQMRCVSCGTYITEETDTIICSDCQKQLPDNPQNIQKQIINILHMEAY